MKYQLECKCCGHKWNSIKVNPLKCKKCGSSHWKIGKQLCQCGCGQLCFNKYVKNHSTKGIWQNPEYRKKQLKRLIENPPHKNKHHTEESKEKNRKAHIGIKKTPEQIEKMKGHKSWNKGLTKETDERIMNISEKNSKKHGEETSFYGKKHTLENIELMKKRQLPQQFKKGRIVSEEERQKSSEITINNIINGKIKKHPHNGSIRKDLKEYGYIFSMFEANMIRYLKYKNIKFEYQVPILLSNNRYYICDFYLPDRNKLFLEIKGYLREKQTEKYNLLQKDYPRMNWRIMFQLSDEWKNIVKEYSKIIPNWEFYKTNKNI
jgi:hypothetical protein